MKKLLTILLVLFSFSGFAQFEAGEYVNSDTVKIDGVPLLLNTFKKDSLGGAGNIFYSTGASSQPASGSINQVMANNLLNPNVVVKWDGTKFANSGMVEVDGTVIESSRILRGLAGFQTYGSNLVSASGYNTSGGVNEKWWYPMQYSGSKLISYITNDAVNAFTTYQEVKRSGNTIESICFPNGVFGFGNTNPSSSYRISVTGAVNSTGGFFKNGVEITGGGTALLGTVGYIPKITGANTLGNSSISDNGSLVSSTLPIRGSCLYAGTSEYANGYVEVGKGGTGNRYALIDLTGDDIYSDFGLRIVRGNGGENAVSEIQARGKGGFVFKTIDAGSLYFATKNTTALTIDTLQNSGFGTSTPAARIHSQSTTTQARLGYDATKYTDLSTGSTGNLTIDPTGDTTKIVGAINSTGGFFKNGVEITGGGGGISNIGLQVPTGLTVAPTAITQNDTFVVSLQSGYSIPTTANQTNWTEGYNNQISTVAFSGSTTKQITLTQKDGGQIFGYFTDLTASDWVTDTYGIKYNAGKVCVGTATSPSFSAELTVGNGSNTTHAISASSLDKSAIFATSSSGFGVNAQSGYRAVSGTGTGSGIGVYGTSSTGFGGFFEGLGCKATKYYVSSLNTAPASSSATGTTGEIRFTSDYIYVCVATNTWKRTQISTW